MRSLSILSLAASATLLLASSGADASVSVERGPRVSTTVDNTGVKDWFPAWKGGTRGANAVIANCNYGSYGGHICAYDPSTAESYAKKLVQHVDGGWLRLGFSIDSYKNDPALWKKTFKILEAACEAGNDEGVVVQVTLRASPGQELSSGEQSTAKRVISDLTSVLKQYKSYALDTINEASGYNPVDDNWAQWNADLVKTARDAGFGGFIAVEDGHWAGGLTAYDESFFTKTSNGKALFEYIVEANGGNTNHLIGSFHDYSTSSRHPIQKELDAIMNTAQIMVQIGEYGNFNSGENDNYVPEAVRDALAKESYIGQSNGIILSWCDEYLDSNGQVDTNQGSTHSNKNAPDTHSWGFTSGISG